MPGCYSFSAPSLTEEDEIRERELLSEQERRELQNDIYGEGLVTAVQQKLHDQANLALFHEAMETIPETDKREYMEAIERVPSLVEKESDPLSFMRCENYDPWAAAKRLAMYWKSRKKTFGPDRAFQPMTLRGAMEADRQAVEQKLMAILPEDQSGRSVLYYDRGRCLGNGRSTGLCVAFYFLQVLSEKQRAQENGYILLADIQGFDPYRHYDRIYTKTIVQFFRACFPTKIKAVHLYAGPRVSPMTGLALGAFKHMVGPYIRLRTLIHWGTDRDVSNAMGECGLGDEHVYFLIGRRGHEVFAAWLQERTEMELDVQRFVVREIVPIRQAGRVG